jgi:hypothetical protein
LPEVARTGAAGFAAIGLFLPSATGIGFPALLDRARQVFDTSRTLV